MSMHKNKNINPRIIGKLTGALLSLALSFSYSTCLAQVLSPADPPLYITDYVPDHARASVNTILEALKNVRLQQSTPLHKEFFGPQLDGPSTYLNVFFSRIQGIHYQVVSGKIYAAFASAPWMILTQNFYTNVGPDNSAERIYAMSLFIHEAWHIEQPVNTEYTHHVACPKNSLTGRRLVSYYTGLPLENSLACDKIYNGSYGVQAIMLYNIGKFCNTCSANEKETALFFANAILRRVIDKEAHAKILNDFQFADQLSIEQKQTNAK